MTRGLEDSPTSARQSWAGPTPSQSPRDSRLSKMSAYETPGSRRLSSVSQSQVRG